jgi:GAF domain-containing protein
MAVVTMRVMVRAVAEHERILSMWPEPAQLRDKWRACNLPASSPRKTASRQATGAPQTMLESANTSDSKAASVELSLLGRAFAAKLGDNDVHLLLAHLNSLTAHRFTGIYRFEPGWVVSVVLFDRENPAVQVGADVKMKESYCWLTGISDRAYVIEDAPADPRLRGHAARDEVRSYVGVLLHDKRKRPWGTLCHFDFVPRAFAQETLARLESLRPLIEEMFVRDTAAQWNPEARSLRRAPLAG